MRVRELLTLIGPSAKVLTAPHRLDREIRWVHTTDLPDPSPYLRGGELILTNGLWYRESSDAARFADALASKGVPALGLALFPGQTVPEGLLEACSAHDILLILLPDVPFRDLTEVVMTRVLGERQDALLQEAPAGKEVAARLGRGEGVAALTDVLTRETGAPCWVLLRDGTTLGQHLPGTVERRTIWEQAFSIPPPRGGVSEIGMLGAGPVTVAPVQFEPLDGEAEAVAMLVCQSSLTSLRQRVDALVRLTEHYLPIATEAAEQQRRGGRDVVTSLLERLVEGSVKDDELCEAIWPNAQAGDESICVLVAGNEGRRSLTPDRLEGALRAVLPEVQPVTGQLNGYTVALVPGTQARLSELAASVWGKLSLLLGSSVLLGVSGGQRSEVGLRQLVLQASNARQVAGSSTGERGWATSREAGSHMLLLATANPDILQSLHLTTLVPLIAYDERNGTNLMETLRTYLAADGSWQRAADILCLHVNSLRYRIARIEQLTGRQMSAIENRVDFFLALQALARLSPPDPLSEQPPTTAGQLRPLAH
jgi:Purine catabolism regulatory protein-like family/PucR C-terminal helix-turn-helix domain